MRIIINCPIIYSPSYNSPIIYSPRYNLGYMNVKHFSIGSSFHSNHLDDRPLLNIIPSVYMFSKNKPIFVYFSVNEFNISQFISKISSKLSKDFVYTGFIKVRYNFDSFFMAGSQFGFNFSSSSDIENLFSVVMSRLEEYSSAYILSEDAIVYIQISFRQKDKKLLSEFSLQKPSYITNHENLLIQDKLNIPVSINEDSIDKPLPTVISNGVITDIYLTINGELVNFLDIIKSKAKLLRKNHIDNIIHFDKDFKFYLLKDRYDYVLAVKVLEENIFVKKIRYSLNGVIINRVIDNVVNNIIHRNSGDKQIVISGDKVISTKQNIKLKAIEKPKVKSLYVENSNIGVIDVETYRTYDNTFKVYALGFKTNLDEKAVIYYIDEKDLDSNKIVFSLIDELLRPKYGNVTFYCHNLGGFDIVYILNALYTYNDKNKDDKYRVSCILRDDHIIKVKISKDKNSLTILDSYSMLPSSLAKLGTNFDVATIKSKFPYRFASQDHLFHTGSMPNIEYYDDISREQYKDMEIGY